MCTGCGIDLMHDSAFTFHICWTAGLKKELTQVTIARNARKQPGSVQNTPGFLAAWLDKQKVDRGLEDCVYCTKLALEDRQDLYSTRLSRAIVLGKLLHYVEMFLVEPFIFCFFVCLGGFFFVVVEFFLFFYLLFSVWFHLLILQIFVPSSSPLTSSNLLCCFVTCGHQTSM